MAEKVKKAKAPAKPRTSAASAIKTVAKKVTAVKPGMAKRPSHEEIARLAYRHWIERGGKNGGSEEDWLRAERELKKT